MTLGKYSKTITALVSGLIGWALLIVDRTHVSVTAHDWVGLAIVVAVALGVYAVPNTTDKEA